MIAKTCPLVMQELEHAYCMLFAQAEAVQPLPIGNITKYTNILLQKVSTCISKHR